MSLVVFILVWVGSNFWLALAAMIITAYLVDLDSGVKALTKQKKDS